MTFGALTFCFRKIIRRARKRQCGWLTRESDCVNQINSKIVKYETTNCVLATATEKLLNYSNDIWLLRSESTVNVILNDSWLPQLDYTQLS